MPTIGSPSLGSPSAVPALLTVREVAALFRVSTKTVRRLIDRGQLRTVRVGSSIRIRAVDVETLLRPDEGPEAGQ